MPIFQAVQFRAAATNTDMTDNTLKQKREASYQAALAKYQEAKKAVTAAQAVANQHVGFTAEWGEAYQHVQAARKVANRCYGVYSRLHRAWYRTP
jgi:uncharacterized protein (DUF1501 family)